jgi:hypothetical protein
MGEFPGRPSVGVTHSRATASSAREQESSDLPRIASPLKADSLVLCSRLLRGTHYPPRAQPSCPGKRRSLLETAGCIGTGDEFWYAVLWGPE